MSSPLPTMTASQSLFSKLIDALSGAGMSIILPGLGQLHNGHRQKALWLFVLFCLFTLGMNSLSSLFAPQNLFLYCFMGSVIGFALVWSYAVMDGAWFGWSRGQRHRVKWQSMTGYLLFLVFGHGIWLGVVDGLVNQGLVRSHLVDRFRIPSVSMEPGLQRRDLIFADRRIHCESCADRIKAGGIVLYENPDRENFILIKRVIGMPGDEIVIRDNEVFRNGESLTVARNPETGSRFSATETGAGGTYTVHWLKPTKGEQRYRVPEGHLFVMGDNRNRSRDSRVKGPIPIDAVIAVPRQIFLSFDRHWNLRWDRIGQPVL